MFFFCPGDIFKPRAYWNLCMYFWACRSLEEATWLECAMGKWYTALVIRYFSRPPWPPWWFWIDFGYQERDADLVKLMCLCHVSNQETTRSGEFEEANCPIAHALSHPGAPCRISALHPASFSYPSQQIATPADLSHLYMQAKKSRHEY